MSATCCRVIQPAAPPTKHQSVKSELVYFREIISLLSHKHGLVIRRLKSVQEAVSGQQEKTNVEELAGLAVVMM